MIGPKRVLLLALAVYTITWGGHFTSGDGATKVKWARAILDRGSSDLDPGPGVEHSKYGVGHTLLAIPALALADAVRAATGRSCSSLVYTSIFIVNGFAFLYLVWIYLRESYPPGAVAATLAILAFATTWWPYTKLDFSEPLVLTFLFGGFLLARRGRPGLGMLVASVVATIRQDAAILVAILAAWHLATTRRYADVPAMIAAVLPAVAINLAANLARYGTLLDRGYGGESFTNPMPVGLWGLLLSPGKSVFLFSPPLLLGCLGLPRFLRTPWGRRDGWFFLAVFVGQVLLFSRWWAWSGDDCWGSRFPIPGVLLMTIPIVEVLRWRAAVAAVAALGVAVQLLGVLICPMDFILLMRHHEMVRRPVYVDGPPIRIDLEDVRYNPQYSQLAAHWVLIRTLLGAPPRPQDPDDAGRVGTAIYDTLPPETWRRNAHWDFVWARPRRDADAPGARGPSPTPPTPGR